MSAKCSCGGCRLCRKRAAFRLRDRAKENARQRELRKLNPGPVRARDRAYYERHRDEILAKRKIYRDKNHALCMARERAYRERLKRDGSDLDVKARRFARELAKKPPKPKVEHVFHRPQEIVRVGIPGWGTRA